MDLQEPSTQVEPATTTDKGIQRLVKKQPRCVLTCSHVEMAAILALANDVASLHDAVLVHAGDNLLNLNCIQMSKELVVAEGVANLLTGPR